MSLLVMNYKWRTVANSETLAFYALPASGSMVETFDTELTYGWRIDVNGL